MTQELHTLDARGLHCPLPILRTRKALAFIQSGEVLEVTATDPGSVKDMTSRCSQTGHELLEHAQDNGNFIIRIRKH